MPYLIMILVMNVVMVIGSHEIGKMTGYLQGKKDALAMNPVNEDLEIVCASLWVGEQNKKYVERENKNAPRLP